MWDVKCSAVTGPVHASAAASSEASAASSSAVAAEQIVTRQRGENKWGGLEAAYVMEHNV